MHYLLFALVFFFELQSFSCAPLSLKKPKDCENYVEDEIEDQEVFKAFFSPVNDGTSPRLSFKAISVFPVVSLTARRSPRCAHSPNTASFISRMKRTPTPQLELVPVDVQLENAKRACVQSILSGDTALFSEIIQVMHRMYAKFDFTNLLFKADDDMLYPLLHFCIKNTNYDALIKLLEAKFQWSPRDSDGKVIMDFGPTDAFNRDAISYACDYGRSDFLQILLSYSPVITADHILNVISLGDPDCLACFHDSGVNIKDLCGKDAMQFAQLVSTDEVIKFLQEIGC